MKFAGYLYFLKQVTNEFYCFRLFCRLSKVEVISYVIDYIHELRETLGLAPCTAGDDDLCHLEFAEREMQPESVAVSEDEPVEKEHSDNKKYSGEE